MSDRYRVVEVSQGRYAVQYWDEPGFFARALWFGEGVPQGKWKYLEWTRGGYDAYLDIRHESRPYAYGTTQEAFGRIANLEGRGIGEQKWTPRVIPHE